MITTVIEEGYATFLEGADDLTGKEDCMLELSATGKVELADAATDVAIGSLHFRDPVSKLCTVALLNKPGTIRCIQEAAIAPGARVVLGLSLIHI